MISAPIRPAAPSAVTASTPPITTARKPLVSIGLIDSSDSRTRSMVGASRPASASAAEMAEPISSSCCATPITVSVMTPISRPSRPRTTAAAAMLGLMPRRTIHPTAGRKTTASTMPNTIGSTRPPTAVSAETTMLARTTMPTAAQAQRPARTIRGSADGAGVALSVTDARLSAHGRGTTRRRR